MKKTLEVKPIVRKSKLGNSYEVTVEELVNEFNYIVSKHEAKIDGMVKSDNEKFEWDKEPDMTTDYGLAKYFVKNLYITFHGNPSQNGGNFIFGKGDKSGLNNYKDIIRDTLSCSELSRSWGYGRNQLGYKFVEEDLETSNKFVDYLINYNIVDLNDYILNNGDYGNKKGEKLQTYGHAILLYLIRSENYDRAKDFLKYADKSFKQAAAKEINSFYSWAERVDSGFVKRLSEHQRESWTNSLDIEITKFLFLSKLYPTAFLDNYGDNSYNLKDYEKFKYHDFNTTLNIISDDNELTIRDTWREELKDFFTVKKVVPTGTPIRINRELNYLDLGQEGKLIVSYKSYDNDRTEKENYLNPQVYGILVECEGKIHSFGSVMWSHYEFRNAIGDLCLELINLGYLPIISNLDPSCYGGKTTIKYTKNSKVAKFIKKFEGEKIGVKRAFNFNWILIKEKGGFYDVLLSFRGHYVSGSYVHDYEANYEYEPYLNKKIGTKVKWLGYDSSDHSYKYSLSLNKKTFN
jgi:hypothetical protein